MVSVSGIGGIPAAVRVETRRTQAGFRVPSAAGSATAAAASSAEGVGGMLALQEQALQAEGSEAARDRGARRHGHALLAELAALQRALLGGGDDPAVLQRLAALSQAVPDAADPALAAAVRALAVRAAVELARRGM